jgi:hypothetical protein
MPNLNSKLRKALKKTAKPQTGWFDVFPAVIGRSDGTVNTDVPGVIWVRNILNNQELRVQNNVAPNLGSTSGPLQIEVGRRVETPNLWQVKTVRQSFSAPAGSGLVPYHIDQHIFPGPDSKPFPRKQIRELTVYVKDGGNFIVQVYGALVRTASGMALIENQEVDLSSYVPASGAVYVNIESDVDGVLTPNDGTPFADKALATKDDVPVPGAGMYRIATVILFETMEELLDEHIHIPMPLEAGASSGGGMWGSITGTLSDQTDLQTALDGKVNDTGDTMTGDLLIDGREIEAKAFIHNDSGISFREQNANGSFVWIKGDIGTGDISGYLRSQLQAFVSTSELISNGTFETGDFTGWTQTGSPTVTNIDPWKGTYSAKCTDADTIKQTITVVNGSYYLLEFAVKSETGFHGIVSITNGDQAAYDPGNQFADKWIRGAALIKATSTSLILEFKAAGGTNFVYFDNVTLKLVSNFSLEGMDSSGQWNVVSSSASPLLVDGVDVLDELATNASSIAAHIANTSNPHSTSDANLSTSDITTNNASTSKHGFLKKLSNVATEFMNGAGNWATPNYPDLTNKPIAETNANDLCQCASPGGPSLWTGTISGAPSGASVTVSAPLTGTEAVLVPASSSQLAKMRLYNTTRGNSALISNYNTGTNVVTLTATAPVNWANGDSLTIASTTVSGGGFNWIDFEITSGPTGKSYMFVKFQITTPTANTSLRIHPTEAFSSSKLDNVFAQVANQPMPAFALIKITSNVFSLAWDGSPTAVVVRESGYLS